MGNVVIGPIRVFEYSQTLTQTFGVSSHLIDVFPVNFWHFEFFLI